MRKMQSQFNYATLAHLLLVVALVFANFNFGPIAAASEMTVQSQCQQNQCACDKAKLDCSKSSSCGQSCNQLPVFGDSERSQKVPREGAVAISDGSGLKPIAGDPLRRPPRT